MTIKLHIGCGDRFIPGFIHIDKKKLSHVAHVANAKDLSCFYDDNTVDLIYACHLLEHFKRNEIDKVLTEWHRILKPSGILRLAVPDFETICKIYQKYKDMELIMGPIHGRGHHHNTHYISFDYRYLQKRLELIGFKNIRRWDWRTIEHKDIDDYSRAYIPHMDFDNGILISLNVEAEK